MTRSRGSGQRRRNRWADSPPPHLGALPHWDEIEGRLRCRWTPHQVVTWHGDQHPGGPQPTARALEEFLRKKPPSWFVVELAIGLFTPPRVPWISVLSGQAALIQILTLRLNTLLAMEHDSGSSMPEVRQSIELLDKLYKSHLAAQHAAGIKLAKQPKSEARRGGFPPLGFLCSPARRRSPPSAHRTEQQVARGEINPIELYRLAAPIFAVERRRMKERGPK